MSPNLSKTGAPGVYQTSCIEQLGQSAQTLRRGIHGVLEEIAPASMNMREVRHEKVVIGIARDGIFLVRQ